MSKQSVSQIDKPQVTLKLSALRHSAFYAPYLLTFSRDYLTRQGLDASYHPATSLQQLTDDLQNNVLHISQSAIGVSLIADPAVDNSIVHFAQINCRDGFFIVARNSFVKEKNNFHWSDLEQHTILADHLFQPLATLKFVLAENKIAPETIDMIDAGDVESMLNAFISGTGDFIHLQGPYAQQLVASGEGRIVAAVGDAIGPLAFSSLCCHVSFINTKMQQVFYSAFQQALRACSAEPAAKLAKDLQYLFGDIDPQILCETISDYQKLGTWRNNNKGNNAAILASDYDNIVKIFLASHDISSTIPFDRYVKQPGYENNKQ